MPYCVTVVQFSKSHDDGHLSSLGRGTISLVVWAVPSRWLFRKKTYWNPFEYIYASQTRIEAVLDSHAFVLSTGTGLDTYTIPALFELLATSFKLVSSNETCMQLLEFGREIQNY